MEIRRVQITGGSSFMITLPKEWAESVGLKKNDPISLQQQSDGSLLLYPEGKIPEQKTSTKVIDVDDIEDKDCLYRQLVGAYIAGHDCIEIRSNKQLSSPITNTISSFVQIAIGLEIMEENDYCIIINDLMDQSEIKPIKSILRMKVLVRNMLNDVLSALETKDISLLEGMNDRDREVDRIDWLIFRQISIYLKDVTLSHKQGISMSSIGRCGTVSRSIERIGDHAVLLARNLSPLIDDSSSDTVDAEIVKTGRDVITLFSDSITTWENRDMHSANECIERGKELVNKAVSISEMSDELQGKAAIAAELIASSVKRVAEYSMDVAEVAINSAME